MTNTNMHDNTSDVSVRLTPTELARLHTEGSVRVVRKAPEPTGFYKGVPVFAQPMDKPHMQVTPFPPAGHREVIDGEDCVWGEVECKQRGVFKNNEVVPIDPERPASVEAFAEWVWVTTIRKDDRE